MVEVGLGQLFLYTRDAVAVADAQTNRIVLWNPAAERLFGYSASEAIGCPIEILVPRPVARLDRERLAYYARTGDVEVLTTPRPMLIPAVGRNRTPLRVEYSLAPLEVPGGGDRFVLMMFRETGCDQPVVAQAQTTAGATPEAASAAPSGGDWELLNQQRTREVELALRRARRAAAHLRNTDDDDRLAVLARVVEARVQAAHRLMEEAADAEAIRAGTFSLELDRVNLVPLVNRVAADARERAAAHRVHLGAPQGLTAILDARRVEHILREAVDRAIRRNPRGSWIDIDLRRPLAGLAEIEVRDYGRRLSARERDQLPNGAAPDPSWAFMQYVAQQHGGNLSVEEPTEGGLRVVITLPTHRARKPTPASAPAAISPLVT